MRDKNIIPDYGITYLALKNIMMRRFNLDIGQPGDPLLDESLLGWEIGLEARDLLYLYFDIEKEFNITIPEEDVAEGKFSTLNNIIEIVCSQLQKKDKEAV